MVKLLVSVCILATLAFSASASPLTSANSLLDISPRVYEDKIKDLLNDVRRRLCYTNSVVPRLDPLIVNAQLPINVQHSLGKLQGNIRDLDIRGLSTFKIDQITMALTLKFGAKIRFPVLSISGKYDLLGKVAGLFDINGEDDEFNLVFRGLQLSLDGAFMYINSTMNLRNVEIGAKLDGFSVNAHDLTDDERVTKFLTNTVSDALPLLVERIPEHVLENVQNKIQELADKALDGLTVAQLLAIISGSVSVLPPIDETRACPV